MNVLNDDKKYYDFELIHQIKKVKQKQDRTIDITDLGAGSNGELKKTRKLKDIVANSAIKRKYGELLFRIVKHYKTKNILELGTCVGIGSLYLATPNLSNKLVTLEGDPNLAQIASAIFKSYPKKLKNVEQIVGNFDDTLVSTLKKMKRVDLAFIDGNHRKEPTLRYFSEIKKYCTKDSILIFDDIHWSEEMLEAWETIQASPDVKLTLDLYRMGLVFFTASRKESEHIQLYF